MAEQSGLGSTEAAESAGNKRNPGNGTLASDSLTHISKWTEITACTMTLLGA